MSERGSLEVRVAFEVDMGLEIASRGGKVVVPIFGGVNSLIALLVLSLQGHQLLCSLLRPHHPLLTS